MNREHGGIVLHKGVSARGVKCPRLPEVPPKKSFGIKPRKEVSRLGIEREHGGIV